MQIAKILIGIFIFGLALFLIFKTKKRGCNLVCPVGSTLDINLCACKIDSPDLKDENIYFPDLNTPTLLRCLEADCRENEEIDWQSCSCLSKNSCPNLTCSAGQVIDYKNCNCLNTGSLLPPPKLRCAPYVAYNPTLERLNTVDCSVVPKTQCSSTICGAKQVVNYTNCSCVDFDKIPLSPYQ